MTKRLSFVFISSNFAAQTRTSLGMKMNTNDPKSAEALVKRVPYAIVRGTDGDLQLLGILGTRRVVSRGRDLESLGSIRIKLLDKHRGVSMKS